MFSYFGNFFILRAQEQRLRGIPLPRTLNPSPCSPRGLLRLRFNRELIFIVRILDWQLECPGFGWPLGVPQELIVLCRVRIIFPVLCEKNQRLGRGCWMSTVFVPVPTP